MLSYDASEMILLPKYVLLLYYNHFMAIMQDNLF